MQSHVFPCKNVHFPYDKVHCFPLFSDTLSLEMRTQMRNESEKVKSKQSIMCLCHLLHLLLY